VNILKSLFGKPGEVIGDPERLRDRLFGAVARDDPNDLAALCRANRDAIRRAYAVWLKPKPEFIGSDPRRVDWYGQNLLAIGRCFAQVLDDRSLLQQLQRPAEQGPFGAWDSEFRESAEMMRAHQYEDALTRLSDLRSKIRSFVGFDAKRWEGVVAGHIGSCLMQTLRADEALACFEESIKLCEEAQDEDGVRAELSNRIEALRWLDRHREAAPWAAKLAGLYESSGNTVEAARYLARARIMAAGEPLLRTTVAMDGRVYEEDETPIPLAENVQILLERNRITLERCTAHLNEGGKHVSKDRYDQALTSFARAMQFDPYEPRPHYESAVIHSWHGRYEQAIRSYQETERLAPGWFLVRSELWLVRQVAAGRFRGEVPRMLSLLEHQPPEQAAQIAQAMADRTPDLPQAWLMLGEALQRIGRRADAASAYRKGLTCAEDPDVRTRLLTYLGASEHPPRRAELEQAAALNGHLVSGAVARLLLRSGKSV